MAQIDAEEIRRIRSIVEPIASKYGIEKMYLFGSRARGDNCEKSDFDFFIHPGEIRSLFEISRLMRDLQNSLDQDVDIVSAGALKEGDVFITEIKKDGVLVYER
ncbi:MAG: nucleotidyltransferase domain-containing protein [Candidatus Methanoplasma sp.]|jgi:predicted nucleotidyltransferase|nr:nucleotidyltransferase domain-containing protein [Candidatus Methanoplasma sp.]